MEKTGRAALARLRSSLHRRSPATRNCAPAEQRPPQPRRGDEPDRGKDEPGERGRFQPPPHVEQHATGDVPQPAAEGDRQRGHPEVRPQRRRVGQTCGDRLLALGRSRQDKVFEIRSDDGGKTWGEMKLGSLPNNNSGTDAVTLKDGRHLILYNHVGGTPGKWGGKRTPLNLALSSDDAQSWQAALVLESDPGEYSYPAIIQTADGLVHATYTWKRQKVKHVVIDPTKLTLRPIEEGSGVRDGLEDALSEVARRRQRLVMDDAPVRRDRDAVGERPTGVDADDEFHPGPLR